MTAHAEAVDIAILGAGFSGLGMAIRLDQAGRKDWTILEKADEVGGTWRENTYPGCACDVASPLYSFSFAQNASWSRMFATQPEILAYLKDCADRFGLRPRCRFGWRVETARWNEDTRRWTITGADGRTVSARVIVSGMGGLHNPAYPEIDGLDRFKGPVFHTARWRHDVDLRARRVAVIGTGASAIQVVPQIQPEVAQLDLYQRTPPWVMPKGDRELGGIEHGLMAVPGVKSLYRGLIFGLNELRGAAFKDPALMEVAKKQALAHLAAQVPDTALRARLTPDYTPGCKRVLIANDYYPAVSQPNVSLVTDGIACITETAIEALDGTARPTDVIILATGFKAMDMSQSGSFFGVGGRSLTEEWQADIQKAYLGMAAPGYPNLFFLMGPNTGLGHNSMIYMIETQIAWILRTLAWLDDYGGTALDVRVDAMERWEHRIETGLSTSVWASGCQSWYMSADGRNATIWPDLCIAYRKAVMDAPARDWIRLA